MPESRKTRFLLISTNAATYIRGVRQLASFFLLAVSLGCSFAGEYLVIFKQHVSANSTPGVEECDQLEVYHGYSKLINKGKPSVEIKSGALIGIIQKRDYAKISGYAETFPALKPVLDEIQTRWKTELEEFREKQLSAQKAFSETVAPSDGITTLDGREYRGKIQKSGDYGISITTVDGVTSIGMAELSSADLKTRDAADRSHDGRFWYERTLAIIKAQEAGKDVAQEAKEAGTHFHESNAYLAGMDRAREERNKARMEEISKSEHTDLPAMSPQEMEEIARMSKLGYLPVLDENTGQILYYPPQDREQQLRETMQEKAPNGN